MADDFRLSELVTLTPGFARAALRAAAREIFAIYHDMHKLICNEHR